MAKSNKADVDFESFANRMKSEPVQIPIQKVIPVPTVDSKEEEAQLTVKIPKSLLKKLRMESAASEKSIKDIVVDVLTNALQ